MPEGPCRKCGGPGRIGAYRHVAGGLCFACGGTGRTWSTPKPVRGFFRRPRPPVSSRLVSGGELDDTIRTTVGDVGVLACIDVAGQQIIIRDLVIYGNDGRDLLVNKVGASTFLAVRNALAREAATAGYQSMRIIARRVTSSSSANPNHDIDRTIDLRHFR